jgi:hypothetical protein
MSYKIIVMGGAAYINNGYFTHAALDVEIPITILIHNQNEITAPNLEELCSCVADLPQHVDRIRETVHSTKARDPYGIAETKMGQSEVRIHAKEDPDRVIQHFHRRLSEIEPLLVLAESICILQTESPAQVEICNGTEFLPLSTFLTLRRTPPTQEVIEAAIAQSDKVVTVSNKKQKSFLIPLSAIRPRQS